MPDFGDLGATATASAGEIGNTSGPAGGSTSASNGGGNGGGPDFGTLAVAGGTVAAGLAAVIEGSTVSGAMAAILGVMAASGQISSAVAMGLSPDPAIALQQLQGISSFNTTTQGFAGFANDSAEHVAFASDGTG
jgi:hypothetical protein